MLAGTGTLGLIFLSFLLREMRSMDSVGGTGECRRRMARAGF